MSEERPPPSLPHAYPFMLLDRVLELRPGISALAVKNLTRDDPLLDGDGYMPPVLLAEALAQAAGLAAFAGRDAVLAALVRINRFRCAGRVRAGDQLLIHVRVRRVFGGTVKVRGVVRVNGRVRAAGEVMLTVSRAAQEILGAPNER